MVPALFETTMESLPLEMLIVLDDSEVVMAEKAAWAHRARPKKVIEPTMLQRAEFDGGLVLLREG